jgi:hypothetical protein
VSRSHNQRMSVAIHLTTVKYLTWQGRTIIYSCCMLHILNIFSSNSSRILVKSSILWQRLINPITSGLNAPHIWDSISATHDQESNNPQVTSQKQRFCSHILLLFTYVSFGAIHKWMNEWMKHSNYINYLHNNQSLS